MVFSAWGGRKEAERAWPTFGKGEGGIGRERVLIGLGKRG